MRRLLLAALATTWAAAAAAEGSPFPARTGEVGLLDVPDAEVVGDGPPLLGAEYRVEQAKHGRTEVGPLPLYAVAPIWRRMDVGFTFREGGQPGDERSRFSVGSALKLKLSEASRQRPAFALDLTGDRLNGRPVIGSRLVASTAPVGNVRFAAFLGGETGEKTGVIWGGAVDLALARETDLVLEGLGGPQGVNLGTALRWRASTNLGMFVGFNYLPGEEGWRASVGFSFGRARKRDATPSVDAVAAARAAAEVAAAGKPVYTTDRPQLKLKMRVAAATSAEPRSLRHGPWTASGPVAAGRPGAPGIPVAVRGSAPSLEELADAQLREQEALSEARERRVRSTAEQLDARDRAAQEEAQRLAERERDLGARDQQLDARERRLGRPGTPTPQQRDLEALEAQIASQERNLGAQERSAGAAIDAAQGRERDAAAREDAERVEASRLAASVSGAASRAQQLDVRKQALGARNRQLAAMEARLVARGERIDTLERQLRTRGSRLDAWQRRLDTRSERLDLVERRAAEPKAPILAPGAIAPRASVAPKDKAIFVMVVKSPTAIVKERGAAAAPTAPAIQPGTAVEKAVAAATVVTFQSPTAQLSELDRETIDNIAKLAAREGCELLIWARAKDPSLMSEAQRRAAEIRSRVMTVAPLADRQVVTRITTRPGAQGVDVVVSALRESARGAPAAAAGAAATAPRAGQLEAGEAGKRQIREAVQAAQSSIEACVGELMEQKKLARAEGALKLTVSAAGKVVKVLSGDGDLSGPGLAECLSSASGGWSFPPADAEYVVEVPITVIRGGAQR